MVFCGGQGVSRGVLKPRLHSVVLHEHRRAAPLARDAQVTRGTPGVVLRGLTP